MMKRGSCTSNSLFRAHHRTSLSLFQKNSWKKFGTCKNFSIFVAVMNVKRLFHRAFDLYYDGFRSMTLGRTLWLVIGIKLFIIFAILKVFFFPDFLRQHAAKGGEAEFVATELSKKIDSPPALPCGEEDVTEQEQIIP